MEKTICKNISWKYKCAVMLICLAVLSVPLFLNGITWGHDTGFHLQRIVSLSEALKNGVFPIRVYQEQYYYFGYGTPLFYCDFFLFIPACLNAFLGISFVLCWKFLLFFIQLSTILISFYSFKTVLKSEETGLIACVLYSLSTYRFVDVFTRGALGESLAMIFLPLVVCGFVSIFRGDYKKWPLLAIGFTGVFFSHMLTFLFTTICSVLFCVFKIRTLVRKNPFLSICKAAAMTVGSTAWFLIPFLKASSLPLNAGHICPDFSLTTLSLGDFLDVFLHGASSIETFKGVLNSSTGYGITKTPGLLILIGAVVFVLTFILKCRDCKVFPDILFCFALGLLFVVLESDLFPWGYLQAADFMQQKFTAVQFAWRFNTIIVLCFSICAAYAVPVLVKNCRAVSVAVLALCVVFSGLFLKTYIGEARRYTDDNMRLYSDTVYLFRDSEMTWNSEYKSNAELTVYDETRHYSDLSFSFELADASDENYIDIPLNYYPVYKTEINGEKASAAYSETGMLRIILPDGVTSGRAFVTSFEPALFLAADIVSLVSMIALVFIMFAGKKEMPVSD